MPVTIPTVSSEINMTSKYESEETPSTSSGYISPVRLSDENLDAPTSPDLFDDSPTNVSRYGRTRKQKLMADCYVGDPEVGTSSSSGRQKSRSPPSKMNGQRRSYTRRTPVKNGKASAETIPNGFENGSPLSNGSCAVTPKKSPSKVYVKKDLIQRKDDKEETESIMRSMFSPVKSEISPNSSPSKLKNIIVLKKSPEGIFECSRKTTFDSEDPSDYPNGDYDDYSYENAERQPVILTEDEKLCKWELGELAWARVGSHPMWPCLITRDPLSQIFARKKMVGRSLIPSYALHVTFFGDNGRHSWLLVNCLMKFTGLDDFNNIKMNISSETRKKDPKYCASFEVKESKRSKWLAAVSEAEMLLRRPPDMREELANMFFTPASNVSAIKKPRKLKKIKIESETLQNGSLSESLFDSLFESDKTNGPKENSNPQNAKNGIKKKNKKDKNQTNIDKWLIKPKKEKDDSDENNIETGDGINGGSDSDSEVLSVTFENHELASTSSKNSDKVNRNEKSNDDFKNEVEPVTAKKRNKRSSDVNIDELNKNAVKSVALRKRRKVAETNGISEEKVHSNTDAEANVTNAIGNCKTSTKYDDPQFLEWLVDNENILQNQLQSHPSSAEKDFLELAYQIWQYSDQNEINKEFYDDDTKSNTIKGIEDKKDDSGPAVKKSKKNLENGHVNSPSASREKSSRKTAINTYFYEGSSDSNDSDKESGTSKNKTTVDAEVDVGHANDQVDDEAVDVYMESLKVPKPNIYKGLSKEKVCEICESPGNLVKCKGTCQGMFHVSCCEKQGQSKVDECLETKDLAKVKKRRGRPKVKRNDSVESNENSENSETADVTQESNACADQSEAKEMLDEVSKGFCVDLDDFELQMSQKMLDIMQTPNPSDSLLSSCDDVHWKDIRPGECVIADLKKMEPEKIVNFNSEEDLFKCHHCISNKIPLCCICKSAKNPQTDSELRQRCNVAKCNQYYHPECLEPWPQTKYTTRTNLNKITTSEIMACPKHVCHTCISDDPKGCKTRFSGDKLARCVKCPATYHSFTQCTPAGTRLITASQIVCPKHGEDKSNKTPNRVNTSWCFICAKGGTLICCETCPTSFHPECLNIPLPEGGYICEECETGRLPLYEELVWVKLGQYRWWPALILHPNDIPPNIQALSHQPGQFAVRFFGGYDHYWVNNGRVFPYQEGDTGHASSKKSTLDTSFVTAINQAQLAFAILKETKEVAALNELKSSLLPPKYVKLKVNRAIGNVVLNTKGEASKCDCNPDSEHPCAPDSDCLNRMLLTECSPSVCAAGSRCCNQYFEKRLYPPLQASRFADRGWGLKVMKDLKKGDFIIEYVGEVVDEAEFQSRMAKRQELRDENYYFLTLDKDRMIDAGPKGNLARFMNHSCEPNCETQKWTVNGDIRVGLFSLQNIAAGSELTFNYNLVCAGDDKKKCLCGTRRCAGYIGAKPKQDDPPPKKPKVVRLKRKYKRKIKKNLDLAKSRKPLRRGRPPGRAAKHLQGIDRDVELIKKSLANISDVKESNEEKTDELYTSVINYDEPLNFDGEEASTSKKGRDALRRRKIKYKGMKRRKNVRQLRLHLREIKKAHIDGVKIYSEMEASISGMDIKIKVEELELLDSEVEVKHELEPKEEMSN